MSGRNHENNFFELSDIVFPKKIVMMTEGLAGGQVLPVQYTVQYCYSLHSSNLKNVPVWWADPSPGPKTQEGEK